MDRKYPAKILLYGEYTVIDRSRALALPLDVLYGRWSRSGNFKDHIAALSTYLLENFDESEMDHSRLKEDVSRDISFDCNIPVGYGVGSSGSVTAAIFDRYFHDRDSMKSTHIRSILARIESFYHGSSSGLDPLVSYYQLPIHITSSQVTVLDRFPYRDVLTNYLLIDSGRNRSTREYVEIFQKMKSSSSFMAAYYKIVDLNNLIIEKIINGLKICEEHKYLSRLQYEHFHPMITEDIAVLWKKGLDEESYYMKLCGAGGGGYYLCLPTNATAAEHISKSYAVTNCVNN